MTAIIGYLTSAFLGWLGLLRRGLLSIAWILLLTPLHWLLLSLAAWRALFQLVTAPYAWEKTEHGLAKSSRQAAKLTRSLLELERHLSALKDTGELPALAPKPNERRGSPAAFPRRSLNGRPTRVRLAHIVNTPATPARRRDRSSGPRSRRRRLRPRRSAPARPAA